MAVKYVKHDPISHILARPDMYVGSKSFKTIMDYVYENNAIAMRSVSICPALIRCLVEILSNAVDNIERSKGKMTKIIINVSPPNTCVITNDGEAIAIAIDETEKIYNHTLIFGHLLSGSNYDDTAQRYVSGRNGLGAKLTNVFSNRFTVEGVDDSAHLSFSQTWTSNMKVVTPPKIAKCQKKSYTRVSFELDTNQFGVCEIPADCLAVFAKHALDAAMTTGLKVTYNEVVLPNKLNAYFSLIDGGAVESYKFETSDTRVWVSASVSDGFEAISFVNGMRTKNGGKHVDAAIAAVCGPIISKYKGVITLRDIKKKIRLLIVSRVVNPEYESQEKNSLEAPKVKIPPISIASVAKILKFTMRDGRTLSSSLIEHHETKTKKLIVQKKAPIEGYDRANYASTRKAQECVLIVCEGLSAKTFAVAGIETGLYGKRGRNYFGIYPLRGKLLNVRNASNAVICKNVVITNLINILGLDYSNPDKLDKLAYGKLCLMTDADVDGIHIEGLVLNFLHAAFPKLLTRGFAIAMKTPILKTISKRETRFYYDEGSLPAPDKNVHVKYFKGLGTTKPSDVREIFGKKVLEFYSDASTDDTFEVAFDKKRATDRKDWLTKYAANQTRPSLDDDPNEISAYSITTHLNVQLVKYFYDDCARTLPFVYDGLKESQRKVVYAAKKRRLVSDLKVAQFGAYVAEHTNYHHGETNLFGTIIKMAQSFPGSNNVPLLAAEGMFGTRLSGGEDAASPRYIYTKMTTAFKSLFPESDAYESRIQDGDEIEPEYYVPTLPVLLLNGCVGIASGWMCACPSFSPDDVKYNAQQAIHDRKLKPMIPWFNGFTGKVVDVGDGKYETKGTYARSGTKITISELPIGLWNDKFKLTCENDESIDNVIDLSTPTLPSFTLCVNDKFDEKAFDKRMTTSLNVNNIVIFDSNKRIRKVTVDEIFQLWAQERLALNGKRKRLQLEKIQRDIDNLTSKINFIKLVKSGTIKVTDHERNVEKICRENNVTNIEAAMTLPVRSLTIEHADKLTEAVNISTKRYDELQSKSERDMWDEDYANLKLMS
jgi:DNA topoisomerase II